MEVVLVVVTNATLVVKSCNCLSCGRVACICIGYGG
jgi:hypothetical protein